MGRRCVRHSPLIALHDLGKFSRPFQAKAEEHWPSTVLGAFQGALPDPGHDSVGYALFAGPLADVLDPILPEWTYAERRALLRALCGHHGRPPLEDKVHHLDEIACSACVAMARTFTEEVVATLAPPALPVPDDEGRAQARR